MAPEVAERVAAFEAGALPADMPSPALVAGVPMEALLHFGHGVVAARRELLARVDTAIDPAEARERATIARVSALSALERALGAVKNFTQLVKVSPIGLLHLEEFRNPVTNAVMQEFTKLLKNKGAQEKLKTLLRESGLGGPRKPDMLGIAEIVGASPAHPLTVEMDLVEVGTWKGADDTFKELHEKRAYLSSYIANRLRTYDLPRLHARLSQGLRSVAVPTDVVVQASKFRLGRQNMVLPLPVNLTSGGRAQYVDWICYFPTEVYKPPAHRFGAPPSQGPQPSEDGLVLYHIHRMPTNRVEVPMQVRIKMRQAIEEWKRQRGIITGRLLPILAPEFERPILDPEDAKILAYLGVAALLLLFAFVAVEAGLLVGVGAAVAEGASAVAALATSVVEAAELGTALLPTLLTLEQLFVRRLALR